MNGAPFHARSSRRKEALTKTSESDQSLLTSAATKLGLILLVAVAVTPPAAAQLRHRQPPEEPQWFKVRITDASVGVYTEGVSEQSQFGGGTSVDYSRFFIGPSLGLGLQGSLYHPNLV